MFRTLVPLLVLASGCADSDAVDPVWLDDACATDDPGYDSPSVDAVAAVERTNCYRNLMGVAPAFLDARLDQAAQAHAEYMAAHGQITHVETAGEEGFTGEAAWDRADAAGYTGWSGIMEVVSYGAGPAMAVDLWMDSVYHRVPFTMPDLDAVGFGLSGLYAAMTLAFPYPSDREEVVVYPVDGQQDVPPDFDSDTESPDPAPDLGLVGYPVTVTVGSAGGDSSQNPYGIEVGSARLTGPDGDVACLLLEPSEDPTLGFTVALLPEAPLAQETEYEAEISLTWARGARTVRTRFVTGVAGSGR